MRLGILGGGQLARMLTLAAYPLGITTLCFDPNPEACAGEVGELLVADYTDEKALADFLTKVDCITIETENIPVSCAKFIHQTHPFYPSLNALITTQDRFLEKTFLQSLGIKVPRFVRVNSIMDLNQGITDLGYPAVLKTRRFGYDGKGQWMIKSKEDVLKSWEALQNDDLILEEFIAFKNELSLIAIRDRQGQTLFYPLTLNHHIHGVLHSAEAPYNNPALQEEAQGHALHILDALDYIGVMTIEYFNAQSGLVANEIAPRVHNSGHWTIEGAQTSQFENHLRAVFGLPLGSTDVTGDCFLLNCLGRMPPIQLCLDILNTHYHQYGKVPRPGRKLGHITLVDKNKERFQKSKKMLSLL